MKVGILGSGSVGQSIAKGFMNEGHNVWLATRQPASEKAEQLKSALPGVVVCDFATAATEAELAILCVKWDGAEQAIELAGPPNLAGKIVIDTSNIIKQEAGTLVYGAAGVSAAEQVQQWLPNSKVVKAFNSVGANMMYKPHLSVTPTMFIAGDDMAAKHQVSDIVTVFGWEVLDNGGLIVSRELEAMALVWIRNTMANGRDHAFKML